MVESKKDNGLSKYLIARLPMRALTFLTALGREPALRAAMANVGYTAEEHAEGIALLFKITSEGVGMSSVVEPGPNHAQEATILLTAWQTEWLPRARAVLVHKHPEEAAMVFAGITTGGDAIANVRFFLDACEALEKGSDRKATRKADHAALESLALRGITLQTRKHLESLLRKAVFSDIETLVLPKTEPANTANAEALSAWVEDWVAVARTVFRARRDLIRLGIAKRRSPGKMRAPSPGAVALPSATPAPPPAVAAPLREEEVAPDSRIH